MASGPSGPDLSPGRIDALSVAAQVAFAARCALRVLPAALPVPTPTEHAIKGFQAAQACCFVPIHVALTGGGTYQGLADEASAHVVEFGQHEGRPRLATQCLSVAAEIAALDVELDRRSTLTDRISALVAVYHDIAGGSRVYEPFEVAADADLTELSTYERGADDGVPPEFFARSLFEGGRIPEGWQSAIKDWAVALGTVGLSSFLEFYLKLCAGTSLSLDTVEVLLQGWAMGTGLVMPEAKPNTEQPAKTKTAADTQQAVNRPPLLMLADRPLDEGDREPDLLGFDDYAESLAVLLDNVVATPFTMSINAPWGAGKTSLANLIAKRLREMPRARGIDRHVICRFNAWMHDDAPNLATALVAEVSREANRNRPRLFRFFQPLPALLLEPGARRWRRAWYLVVVVALAVAVFWWVGGHLQHVDDSKKYEASLRQPVQQTNTTTTDANATVTSRSSAATSTGTRATQPSGQKPPVDGWDSRVQWLQDRLGLLGAFLTAAAGLVGALVKLLSSTNLLSFVQSPEKAAEDGTIQAARRQLRRLIRQATLGGNRFVVFVDDIERCKPPRAVDVLDAVNQLLDHDRVIVVLLGDMATVAAAAQLKYKDLVQVYATNAELAPSGTNRNEVFGRLYIQKIVQFQFDLPALSSDAMQDYVASLLKTVRRMGAQDGRSVA